MFHILVMRSKASSWVWWFSFSFS